MSKSGVRTSQREKNVGNRLVQYAEICGVGVHLALKRANRAFEHRDPIFQILDLRIFAPWCRQGRTSGERNQAYGR
jgi:hypothetical protein